MTDTVEIRKLLYVIVRYGSVLRSHWLCQFVQPRIRSENSEKREEANTELNEVDNTKSNLSLAYLFTSVVNRCNAIV